MATGRIYAYVLHAQSKTRRQPGRPRLVHRQKLPIPPVAPIMALDRMQTPVINPGSGRHKLKQLRSGLGPVLKSVSRRQRPAQTLRARRPILLQQQYRETCQTGL